MHRRQAGIRGKCIAACTCNFTCAYCMLVHAHIIHEYLGVYIIHVCTCTLNKCVCVHVCMRMHPYMCILDACTCMHRMHTYILAFTYTTCMYMYTEQMCLCSCLHCSKQILALLIHHAYMVRCWHTLQACSWSSRCAVYSLLLTKLPTSWSNA